MQTDLSVFLIQDAKMPCNNETPTNTFACKFNLSLNWYEEWLQQSLCISLSIVDGSLRCHCGMNKFSLRQWSATDHSETLTAPRQWKMDEYSHVLMHFCCFLVYESRPMTIVNLRTAEHNVKQRFGNHMCTSETSFFFCARSDILFLWPRSERSLMFMMHRAVLCRTFFVPHNCLPRVCSGRLPPTV